MKTIKKLFLFALILSGTLNANAQKAATANTKPTIIFVHGIWADGSSFANQITALQEKGYPVISVQNPLTSLADDVAATQRAINLAQGKVILVGHSWGGFVITQAGNDPKVAGLVYVAAIAPDEGESLGGLAASVPAVEISKYFTLSGEYIYLNKEGIFTQFAQDVSVKQKNLIYATQGPAPKSVFAEKSGAPAWKQKPSWYIVAKDDKAINPELERIMAKKIKAKTTEIAASHVVMLSHPKEVLAVIEDAASARH